MTHTIDDAAFAHELARRLNALIGARPQPDNTVRRDRHNQQEQDAFALVQCFCVDLAQAVDDCPTLIKHPTIVHREQMMVDGHRHKAVGLVGLLNGLCGEALIAGAYTDAGLLGAFLAFNTRAALTAGEHPLPLADLPASTAEVLERMGIGTVDAEP